ncbi:SMP-30/gluconolactonase/LRE family protein [Comamonas testosteroni]|uniref:SMP-30/gluconolactonase/LRE family protein n=1 Tax=Comamonas testosteroni TaxID=285 RepID=UPI002DB7633E|nr:SMP-30/gluconolactonase/LRE family protein [Comamonas testosteroni]
MYWAEGPVYFPAGRYLLVSDVPSNRIMRYDEVTEHWGEFRSPTNFSNGLARDYQGRLIVCEHLTRRLTRTEHDGSITVLADSFQNKRLNSPNDVACHPNGSIWFTDPTFGISGEWEGDAAKQELPHSVYCITSDGEIICVESKLAGPNGIAFTPDYKQLYVVESRAVPSRIIWRFDISADGRRIENKTKVVDADGAGAIDGICVDMHGNIWCGWGSDGRGGASSDELDGVKVFNNSGAPIGFIRLPERCANLTFGGPKLNRLYMASSHSLYAVYVGVRGVN